LIKQICLQLEADIIEMEIMPEHVHLLLEGKTSCYLRKEFKSLTTKLPALWTNSYFVSTVGGAPFGKEVIF
jgi:putative transposase